MAAHTAQTSVSNPMDYNRAQIKGLCKLMQDMGGAIDIAPENFAAIDLTLLWQAVSQLEHTISALATKNAAKDWTRVTA